MGTISKLLWAAIVWCIIPHWGMGMAYSADTPGVAAAMDDTGGGRRLTVPKAEVKWNQPPDMEFGVNLMSTFTIGSEPPSNERRVADDWRCTDPRPVTDVHFWGSYIGWRDRDEIDSSISPPGVKEFVIHIYSDVPAGADPDLLYSHPGELLYTARIS